MKILKLNDLQSPPNNFTGIVQFPREKIWYKDGLQHRDDGPAIESNDGSLEWRFNNMTHRINGPAYIDSEGNKWWCQNGESHRVGGPAYEGVDGTKQWYVDGDQVSKEQHALLVDTMKLKGLL